MQVSIAVYLRGDQNASNLFFSGVKLAASIGGPTISFRFPLTYSQIRIFEIT